MKRRLLWYYIWRLRKYMDMYNLSRTIHYAVKADNINVYGLRSAMAKAGATVDIKGNLIGDSGKKHTIVIKNVQVFGISIFWHLISNYVWGYFPVFFTQIYIDDEPLIKNFIKLTLPEDFVL